MVPLVKQFLGACAVLCAAGGLACAQEPPQGNEELKALRALIEQQQKQIDELMKRGNGPAPVPTIAPAADQSAPAPAGDGAPPAVNVKLVQDIVADYLGGKQAADAAANKDKLATDGYRVGTDLRVRAEWRDGSFLWLSSPNNDFTVHPGIWFNYDNVWFSQNAAMRAAQGKFAATPGGPVSGVGAGGIGDYEDGTYFRRIYPFIEGTLWENYEYRLILALSNDTFNTVGLDEFWAGVNNVPVVGTIKVGHVKTPMGLEGDMTSSSRNMTFMERSAYCDAIEMNQNFVTGIQFLEQFLDNRATFTSCAFRQDVGSASGVAFGDGQWGMQGRLTALPLWDGDGRHYLHVGLSGGWRNGTNNITGANGATAESLRTFDLRARPELRDDDPASSPAGSQVTPDADGNRMIDTGTIVARQQFLVGTELLYVRGPFSFQAEYGCNFIDDATGIGAAGASAVTKLAAPTNYVFSGGYVQLAYTLTGESRAYDQRIGSLSRYYYGDKGPFTNAWFVRDENGKLNWGLGAWEIAMRYSYVNLNDGSGSSRINGGELSGFSFGLNWYLNKNMNVMFDLVSDRRFDVPAATAPGVINGFGIRTQIQF